MVKAPFICCTILRLLQPLEFIIRMPVVFGNLLVTTNQPYSQCMLVTSTYGPPQTRVLAPFTLECASNVIRVSIWGAHTI